MVTAVDDTEMAAFDQGIFGFQGMLASVALAHHRGVAGQHHVAQLLGQALGTDAVNVLQFLGKTGTQNCPPVGTGGRFSISLVEQPQISRSLW